MSEWLELGKKQSSLFVDNNLSYMESLVTCIVPRKIMHMCYYILLANKKIKKIEDLPLDQKTSIWEMAKEISNGRLGGPDLIILSKCLYALEFFLNQ